MRCCDLTGSRDGEREAGGRIAREEHVSSSPLPPHPRLLRALLTGGAWLVMSREVARFSRDQQIATTYRLWRGGFFPLPSPPLYLSSTIPLSLLIPLSWCLRGVYDLSRVVSRSWPQRAGGVFHCSWCVKRPTYSIPERPAVTCSTD